MKHFSFFEFRRSEVFALEIIVELYASYYLPTHKYLGKSFLLAGPLQDFLASYPHPIIWARR